MVEQNREIADYPVHVSVQHMTVGERAHLVLRLVIVVALGFAHQSLMGVFVALYVLVPMLVGIFVSRPGQGVLAEDRARLVAVLEWVLGFYAYLLLATDRFPIGSEARAVKLTVTYGSEPTLTSALMRLLTSLPQAAWLLALGVAAAFSAVVLAVHVMLGAQAPAGLTRFPRDVVVSLARFFAYHASLVDAYPPWLLGGADDAAADPCC
jgi:hypothetical protein